jgi:hypothetical protein
MSVTWSKPADALAAQRNGNIEDMVATAPQNAARPSHG